MARSRIDRNTSRRDFFHGAFLIIAAGFAPLAELSLLPISQGISFIAIWGS